jgi:hypothetical protein
MYLIPYIHESTFEGHSEFTSQILWLFLAEKGKSVWQTDEEGELESSFVMNEYFIPNGMYGTIRTFTKDICLFEVDCVKTKIEDFWMWLDEKVKEDDILWRPFFMIKGKDNYAWEEQAEKHSLGSFGSIQKIWSLLNMKD